MWLYLELLFFHIIVCEDNYILWQGNVVEFLMATGRIITYLVTDIMPYNLSVWLNIHVAQILLITLDCKRQRTVVYWCWLAYIDHLYFRCWIPLQNCGSRTDDPREMEICTPTNFWGRSSISIRFVLNKREWVVADDPGGFSWVYELHIRIPGLY